MRRLLLVAAVALAAAVPAARAQATNPLTAALAKTAQAKSERFAMKASVAVTPGGKAVTISGAGATDNAAGVTLLNLDLSKLAAGGLGQPADWRARAIVVARSGTMYLRFPLLAKLVHVTKPWLELDLHKLVGLGGAVSLGSLVQLLVQESPAQQAQVLRAVTGPVKKLGTATVRGAATTHYRAAIDYRKYERIAPAAARPAIRSVLPQLRSPLVPVDVYVAADGTIRRLSSSYVPKSSTTARSLSIDLYDYGAPVTVQRPAPAQVADATGALQQAAKGG